MKCFSTTNNMAAHGSGSWLRGLRGAVVASAVGTAAVVSHAFQVKKQFYPAVVYVVNSNVSMMVSLRAIAPR